MPTLKRWKHNCATYGQTYLGLPQKNPDRTTFTWSKRTRVPRMTPLILTWLHPRKERRSEVPRLAIQDMVAIFHGTSPWLK
ncbi:hypothetical protein CEB3_c00110 [Peptococcaceae bacterium CEB3]|nr:hypothetical protein CEB3_c08980 [Peptococcaceae bacterium CEB3]KLU62915.1 hypothetical protein CEB3_c06670 [Peptococcaceae bacterium CEB3]KLU62961.1 hypothetical protein CEB3_c06230 [Peptococcaceae bacterium CEB3]KLU63615.1 hypothetical protein CEB3_c00110 [Peptococcaceae bacterium CEB3]